MNNFKFNILKNGEFVGGFSTSFEKNDINSQIYRIYNSENDSYQDIKITAELLKPKKIEKIKTSVNENYIGWTNDEKIIIKNMINLVDKINEIIDEINRQKS